MKISLPLILASISPAVVARGCTSGIYYCGSVLLGIGMHSYSALSSQAKYQT